MAVIAQASNKGVREYLRVIYYFTPLPLNGMDILDINNSILFEVYSALFPVCED